MGDKTQMKDMEMDKTKEIIQDKDYKEDEMMMEESKEDIQMYKFEGSHPVSNGIPPSITLQLAASKIPLKSSSMMLSSTTTATTAVSMYGNNQQSLNMKAEQKMGGMIDTPEQKEIKSTLKKLLEGNHEMMRS